MADKIIYGIYCTENGREQWLRVRESTHAGDLFYTKHRSLANAYLERIKQDESLNLSSWEVRPFPDDEPQEWPALWGKSAGVEVRGRAAAGNAFSRSWLPDWSNESPSIGGFYWYRENSTASVEPFVVQIIELGDGELRIAPQFDYIKEGQWAGPIFPPKG